MYKGSGIVVMDTEDHRSKLQAEMTDNATYMEVNEDRTKTIENKVKKMADDMRKKGSISKDLKGFLTSSGGTSGKLQGNPKLHKTLRTIVNGRNHPTEKMAEIVEMELRAHVTSLPSYIKD
jgi:polyhydroxyalkanoate synthesis regulator phasin